MMAKNATSMPYPHTKSTAVYDVYESALKGPITVFDPYRWLEEDSTARAEWVQAQNRYTANHLEGSTARKCLEKPLKSNCAYKKFGPPSYAQDRWYWTAQDAGQEQPVLYRSSNSELPDPGGDGYADIEADAELYFDTNLLSTDGTTSLTNWAFSPDGKYVAYCIARSGSDIQRICIRQASSAPFNKEHMHLADVDSIELSAFGSIVWDMNSKGIFYNQLPLLSRSEAAPSKAKLLYHVIGTRESKDYVILASQDPTLVFVSSLSSDGRYLILQISRDVTGRDKIWVADLRNFEPATSLNWIKLNDRFDKTFEYISNNGQMFYILTDENCDRNYMIRLHILDSGETKVHPLPQLSDKGLFLRQFATINDECAVAVYTRDVKSELYVLWNSAPPQRLDPDFDGTITIDPIDDGFFASFVGYTTPPFLKKFTAGSKGELQSWSLWRSTRVPGLPLSEFIVEQLWYSSKDGTQVSMWIVRHRDTPLNGTAPCLQHAYGGIGGSLFPFFSPSFLTFLHLYGGVLAVPIIRGGLEFGSAWRDAGNTRNKLNSIQDFITATEYLVQERYVSPSRVAIYGWSTGSELMSQAIRFSLEHTYACGFLDSGAYDMLRFPRIPPGVFWINEIGDPEKPDDFDVIFALSPLHNVPAEKSLPATLVTAGECDDRVAPLYAYKYIATLQHLAASSSALQLLNVASATGHSGGGGATIELQHSLLALSFIAQSLGLPSQHGCDFVDLSADFPHIRDDQDSSQNEVPAE